MNRSAPQPQMAMTISMDTYTNLCAASADTGYQKEVWEIAAEAVRDWLARNAPDSFGMPATSGLQWKDLFLPTGTVLRTIFQGKNYHCMVEGDTLQYEGRAISPSGFANGVGGAGRNAWKVIWVLFPKTTTWKLAHTLRQPRPRRIVKKAIRTGDQGPGGRPSAAAAAPAGGSGASAARQAPVQAQGKRPEGRHQRRSGLGHLRRGSGEIVRPIPAGVAPDAHPQNLVKPGVVDVLGSGEPSVCKVEAGGAAETRAADTHVVGASRIAIHSGKQEAVYNHNNIERGVAQSINPLPLQTDTCLGDWFYSEGYKYQTTAQVKIASSLRNAFRCGSPPR